MTLTSNQSQLIHWSIFLTLSTTGISKSITAIKYCAELEILTVLFLILIIVYSEKLESECKKIDNRKYYKIGLKVKI